MIKIKASARSIKQTCIAKKERCTIEEAGWSQDINGPGSLWFKDENYVLN